MFCERMAGHESRVARKIDAGLRLQRADGRERRRHQCGVCVLRQRQGLGRPFPDDAGEVLAQCRIDLLEHRACRPKGVGEGLAHADHLAALARKYESERHSLPLMRSGPKTPRHPPCQAERWLPVHPLPPWTSLAFSSELLITRASARSRLGTERTAARPMPCGTADGPASRVPAF